MMSSMQQSLCSLSRLIDWALSAYSVGNGFHARRETTTSGTGASSPGGIKAIMFRRDFRDLSDGQKFGVIFSICTTIGVLIFILICAGRPSKEDPFGWENEAGQPRLVRRLGRLSTRHHSERRFWSSESSKKHPVPLPLAQPDVYRTTAFPLERNQPPPLPPPPPLQPPGPVFWRSY